MGSPLQDIFKAYDIRGIYPEQLDESVAVRIGRAFGRYMGAKTVLVGRDMRLSSLSLRDSFCDGLRQAGAAVVDAGLCSTPMFYYVAKNYPAAAMVTASHNPANYNGFKLCRASAEALSGERLHGLGEIRALIEQTKNEVAPKQSSLPPVTTVDCLADYTQFLARFAKFKRPLKVVIDASNGMAGYTLPPLLVKLPQLQVERLYFELDGNFPHHEANPVLHEALADLRKTVMASKADCGVIFDGDADRVAFVDERGEPVRQDIILALLAQALLEHEPGATVLYDLRATRMVPKIVAQFGGKAFMTRVGHSYINEEMRKRQAALAGELSGHYYFKGANYVDDAVLAMIYLLDLLSGQERPLSALVKPLSKTIVSGELNFKVANPSVLIAKVKAHYAKYPQQELDGLLVETDEWWFNLRPSNTQPLVRLNVEAKTKKRYLQLMYELENLLGDQDAQSAES